MEISAKKLLDNLQSLKAKLIAHEKHVQNKLEFSQELIEYFYQQYLNPEQYNPNKLRHMDNSGYLEQYLLQHCNKEHSSNPTFIKSMIVLINYKFRHHIYFWEVIAKEKMESTFSILISGLVNLNLEALSYGEKIEYFQFLIHLFNHIEEEFIEQNCLRLVGIGLWKKLSGPFLKSLFLKYPALLKRYKENILSKSFEEKEVNYFNDCIADFWTSISKVQEGGDFLYNNIQIQYFEKFLEFLIDLLSQPATRRHARYMLFDQAFVISCKLTQLYHSKQGILFKKLIEILQMFQDYSLDEEKGTLLPESTVTLLHYDKMMEFQNLMFKNFKERFEASLIRSINNIDSRKALMEILDYLNDDEIITICQKMNLSLPKEEFFNNAKCFRSELSYMDLVIEILLNHLIRKKTLRDVITSTPLYPTETLIWDQNLMPEDHHGRKTLPLPKLNLQFLSIEDYLIRNFNLFRLEASYQIKLDLEDAIKRVHPVFNESGKFAGFNGWAKMATDIKEFIINDVEQPKLGSDYPNKILAEVRYSTSSMNSETKNEWEQLKQHDIIFLISFRRLPHESEIENEELPFQQQYGVQYIRGAEVVVHYDEDRNEIGNAEDEEKGKPYGTGRSLVVLLDPIQYKQDLETISDKDTEVYGSFQLIVRRKAKENNFKAILSTIKDLIKTELNLADWLQDILLGFGDLESEEYLAFKSKHLNYKINYLDTFVDAQHFKETFLENSNISNEDKEGIAPSALLKPEVQDQSKDWLKNWNIDLNLPYYDDSFKKIVIKRKQNNIRFTPKQVEAIHHSVTQGLTLIEGPPGTGKTDVAVQAVSLLYHNFPTERTLIITHSNHALNDIFEKISNLDINERYLLRLGMGEKELNTQKDFSKKGRVNHMLERRMRLLEEVKKLSQSLNVNIYHQFTCETAEIFYRYHVKSRWDEYENSVLQKFKNWDQKEDIKQIGTTFPFLDYLSKSMFFTKNILTSTSNKIDEEFNFFEYKDVEAEIEKAKFYWELVKNLFVELEECRGFEILRSNKERGNYLVSKQSRIVAMTCTHAGLKRADLIESDFEYDNIIVEEAGQILEIENFIPLLLQNLKFGSKGKLKRVILIGDHNQLPPIIKNTAFQKSSNMEQSMFTRLIRLGLEVTRLNDQGRCRPSIMELFKWRYPTLKNLPNVLDKNSVYGFANAGFRFDYQFINVPEFNGKGETAPRPHFYQNLAEAEYVVATYMFMVLNGYPPEKITILTTYNGQKFLIRDIIHQKCSWNPIFKKPKISTIDKFQGQQNDYILMSLVRTESVGHFRDPRRLTVAFSRARLGLYVFGSYELFINCYELKEAFHFFQHRPRNLLLVQGEGFPTKRVIDSLDDPSNILMIESFQEMYKLVQKLLEEKI